MKSIFATLCTISAVLSFTGCDYVSNPNEGDGGNGPDITARRYALLIDFTGHNCQNCPAAAKEAENIVEDLGECVLVLAAHGDFPGLTNPVGLYEDEPLHTDFRTPEAIHLQNIFDVSFLPSGVVSGIETGGTYWQPFNSWRSLCEEIIAQDAPAEIAVDAAFNANNRNYSGQVNVEMLQPFDGDLQLTLTLVEDSVIDWQLNGTKASPANNEYEGGLVENYVHRHVLRRNLNGVSGTVINSGSATTGDSFSLDFNTTLEDEFNEEHMYLYAYIYDGATYEILHAAAVKLVE